MCCIIYSRMYIPIIHNIMADLDFRLTIVRLTADFLSSLSSLVIIWAVLSSQCKCGVKICKNVKCAYPDGSSSIGFDSDCDSESESESESDTDTSLGENSDQSIGEIYLPECYKDSMDGYVSIDTSDTESQPDSTRNNRSMSI